VRAPANLALPSSLEEPLQESDKKRVAIACQGGGSHTAFTADSSLMAVVHRGDGASGPSSFCHFLTAVTNNRMPTTSSSVETTSLWPPSEDTPMAAPKTRPNRRPCAKAHGYAAGHEAKGYDQPTPVLKQKQHHDEIEWHQRGRHD
jgi:hypothetical protein